MKSNLPQTLREIRDQNAYVVSSYAPEVGARYAYKKGFDACFIAILPILDAVERQSPSLNPELTRTIEQIKS